MARERDDDEGYSDEPARRRPDDDDDDVVDDRERRRRAEKSKLTGIDGLFANTNIVVLILFSCLCNGIALILGIVGLVTCKDPTAKKNAMIVTIAGAIFAALFVILQIIGTAAGGGR
jgi:hypothetical protein